MDTYTVVYQILLLLVPVLGIVLTCYQLYKEMRKKDHTKEESEPSVSVRLAHLDEADVDIHVSVRNSKK